MDASESSLQPLDLTTASVLTIEDKNNGSLIQKHLYLPRSDAPASTYSTPSMEGDDATFQDVIAALENEVKSEYKLTRAVPDMVDGIAKLTEGSQPSYDFSGHDITHRNVELMTTIRYSMEEIMHEHKGLSADMSVAVHKRSMSGEGKTPSVRVQLRQAPTKVLLDVAFELAGSDGAARTLVAELRTAPRIVQALKVEAEAEALRATQTE